MEKFWRFRAFSLLFRPFFWLCHLNFVTLFQLKAQSRYRSKRLGQIQLSPLMKHSLLTAFTAIMFVFSAVTYGADNTGVSNTVRKVSLHGYIGQKINDCISHRVITQNVDEIISPFLHQDEVKGMWGSEFWGKWVQGAIGCYRYNGDPALYQMIADSEKKLMAAQLTDGYIGNYDAQHQLTGWDVWGRKYSTLGLLKWYDLSGDRKALKSACRLMDYTINQIGPNGKEHIYNCGLYKGMASCSILEPVMFLYRRTQNRKYLDFAKYIVSEWESADGPQLLAKVDVPVGRRFPVKSGQWWAKENGQKAYEMMSCYVGLLELYKVTHEEKYLKTVETVVRHIIEEEINLCGSGAANECWYGGNKRQTRPAYHSMETCVTFTWMQLNERLLQITGNPVYADHIEATAYNALMAAMKGDGSQIAKYTPLEGFRHEGEKQCNLNINCCNANGPRAFALIPRFAYMTRGNDSVTVNFYAPSEADIQLGKNNISIETATNYPLTDKIEITLNPQHPVEFNLCLRIPAWSRQNSILLNGEKANGITPGSYYTIKRTWKKGDKVVLQLDLRTRLTELNGMQALQRGPVTLARDTRFNDGFIDETAIIQSKDGYVDAQPIAAPQGVWMAFSVLAVTGTDLESFGAPHLISFCDFASAGNTWNQHQRYRVWLTKTLSAITEPQ